MILILRKNPMLTGRKIIFWGIIFLGFSMPLCAMEREDVNKVLAMNKRGKVRKFLDTKTNADAISLKALVALRGSEWAAHKVVDTLISYASPTDIEREVSEHPGNEGTYATRKMRAKACEASRPLSELNDEELLRAWDDHSTVSKTLLERVDEDSVSDLTSSDSEMNSDEDSDDPLRNFNNLVDRTRRQVRETKRRDTDRNTLRIVKRERRAKRLQEIRERHPIRRAMIEKNDASFFSYVKWAGLCAGIAGFACYLYAHKDHKTAISTK
jgi:hypothetical protein